MFSDLWHADQWDQFGWRFHPSANLYQILLLFCMSLDLSSVNTHHLFPYIVFLRLSENASLGSDEIMFSHYLVHILVLLQGS